MEARLSQSGSHRFTPMTPTDFDQKAALFLEEP